MRQIQRSAGSRPCRTEMLPPITDRASVRRLPTHSVTPPTVLRSTSTPLPPVCNFVSYILMCVWNYIYLEHSVRLTLLYTRTLPFLPDEDVDLHRPATRRRRRAEFPNPAVHIPSATHQYRTPNTHRTNTFLQSHQ